MILFALWSRKISCLKNSVRRASRAQKIRNLIFMALGLGLMSGLYVGFSRFLAFLRQAPLIGPLIVWKLTAMAFLTAFIMVAISGLLTALGTLYYSADLNFLFHSPIDSWAIFADKSLEVFFYASWTLALALAPYDLALTATNHYGAGFFFAFLALLPPFFWLAAAIGIAATLLLLFFFPSSRTRDAVWMLSSFSLTLVYILIRWAQPEKLVRPGALRVISAYLQYLQAPTAPGLPSWWLTKALWSLALGHMSGFVIWGTFLWSAALISFAGLILLSRKLYARAYLGAQESPRQNRAISTAPIANPFKRLWPESGVLIALLWKEQKTFFRDVRQWSQLLLIAGLIAVYLFSIAKLPLDNPSLRSLVSFLNIGAAGFVLASLGLRFTFPSVSLENRRWWILKSAPISIETLMREKFIFSSVPMACLAAILGAATNRLLGADAFSSRLSLTALLVLSAVISSMGVGFGALFPKFDAENIHQVESSLGGFVYMAAAFFFVGMTVAALAWPMRMHFMGQLGQANAWRRGPAVLCFGAWILLNLSAATLPWIMGRRHLEAFEQ
ncbi:MAG: putative ABC transporter permease subunit [Elusimicrobiota bacterium]